MIDLDDIALLYDESEESETWTPEELEQMEYEYNKTRYYALPL